MKKIKLNWPYLVVIGLGSFMIFILTLIYLAGDTGDLVTDNYYEHSLKYQEETIDAANRASTLVYKPEIKIQVNGILISFPDSYEIQNGNVLLMRGVKKENDIHFRINENAKEILIPAVKLEKGEYDMSLRWEMNDEFYLIQKVIEWIPR
ncbi:putative protein conserved in bacteria [Candidatus Ornithobacterium hominis]|uniref:FixH family protein n=1 Tax=Candidatus Ornithobacterium hominis TaxID=2497989 RepID=UPI0024BCDB70|nr:FixH family protein [Candidatus Ornithobacterium hominis]CAI9428778.1 putative protein conserved in bacteria [Candidatus Ornithobacterium hominis]